ncbi:MAG: hypothetical protein IJJ40_00900 [Clostridia bacterium]|nr:hypothetical protein [Clostridia bacterium]
MKIKRTVAILVLTALILSLFTGCNALDKARDHRAVYLDKAHTEIQFRDKTYKSLPENMDFNPIISDYDFCSVTEKDVPILLSEFMATEDVLPTLNDEILFKSAGEKSYARSDVYEKYEKLFKEYTLDTYTYISSTYYSKTNKSVTKRELIKKSDVEIIDKAISEGERCEIPEEATYGSQFEIELSDKSLLFARPYYCIFINSDSVYILLVDKGVAYKVSNEYIKDFANMELEYQAEHLE